MASFAKIGLNNKVIEVVTIHNNELLDANGVEQEVNGVNFLTTLTGWAIWKQTSYNNNIRKNYAGIGYTYDEDRDAFIPPKPYPSWTLNEDTCLWEPPTPRPNEAETKLDYVWNEETLSWDVQPLLGE
tara:strand:+ start:1122 stop:1505 length:384 start_codon:yes stop_codon:yes gene_type:complete